MIVKVIELNDNAITVFDENGVLGSSAGFVRDDGQSLVVGDKAESEFKRHPTQIYNKFWSQLSVEPISSGSVRIRHMADLAFAHLQKVVSECGIEAQEPVLLAIPSSFSREQLGILLGIAKPAGLHIAGLANIALLSARNDFADLQKLKPPTQIIHAELQQHQVVLSNLVVSSTGANHSVTLANVVQIPGVGWQNVIDSLMLLVSDLFVEQCRLNPQKNADTEQQLYNSLPHWLNQEGDGSTDSTLTLELETADQNYIAKLPRASLIEHLHKFYSQIVTQIDSLKTSKEPGLLVSQRLAMLPDLIPALESLSSHCHVQSSFELFDFNGDIAKELSQRTEDDQPLQLVNRLDFQQAIKGDNAGENVDKEEFKSNPTHVLLGEKAIAVNNFIIESENQELGHIRTDTDNAIYLVVNNESREKVESAENSEAREFSKNIPKLHVNHKPVTTPHRLFRGDRIGVQNSQQSFMLIEVE